MWSPSPNQVWCDVSAAAAVKENEDDKGGRHIYTSFFFFLLRRGSTSGSKKRDRNLGGGGGLWLKFWFSLIRTRFCCFFSSCFLLLVVSKSCGFLRKEAEFLWSIKELFLVGVIRGGCMRTTQLKGGDDRYRDGVNCCCCLSGRRRARRERVFELGW
jgi:hypothetical protein